MSDAFSAASMISGQLSAYRMIDGMREARERRIYESEVAYFRACNQWLNEALDREIAERNRIINTANAREADYQRRIADLEAKYKERDARAVYDEERKREKYNRLVGRFNDLLAEYRALRDDTQSPNAG